MGSWVKGWGFGNCKLTTVQECWDVKADGGNIVKVTDAGWFWMEGNQLMEDGKGDG